MKFHVRAGGLLLLAVLVLMTTGRATVVAKEFNIEKEVADIREYLAKEHVKLGESYEKKKLYTDAASHYYRALVLVPEYPSAMKAMGWKKVDGEWVMDKPLPKEDGISGDAAEKAREGLLKSRDKAYGKMAAKLRGLARTAAEEEKDEDSRILWGMVLYYDAENAEAHQMRGHIEFRDEWTPGFLAERRKRCKELVRDATPGVEEPKPDPQSEGIGAKLYVRSGNFVIARTTVSDKRSADLHKVLVAAWRYCHELLKADGHPFGFDKNYTMTQLTERSQYEAMVEHFSGAKDGDKDRLKNLGGTYQDVPWGYFVWSDDGSAENQAELADDRLSNECAIQVLKAHRGTHSDPWIRVGFSYVVTAHLLGTTRMKRVAAEEDEGVTAVPAPATAVTKDARTPDGMRALMLQEAFDGTDVSLRALTMLETNGIFRKQAAKAFSFMEFAFEVYPSQAAAWLASKVEKNQGELESMENAGGMSIEELEDNWRRWVLANY